MSVAAGRVALWATVVLTFLATPAVAQEEGGAAGATRSVPVEALAETDAVRPPDTGRAARPAAADRPRLDVDSLTVGVLPDEPPFSYITPSGYRAGFDFDLARALCEELRVPCRFREVPRGELLTALRENRIDLAIASLAITEENDAVVDFTAPYHAAGARFVIDTRDLVNFSEPLAPETVLAAVDGTPHAAFLESRHGNGVKVRTYIDERAMWIDLALDRIDAVLTTPARARENFLDERIGEDFALSDVEVRDEAIFGRGVGIAVREGRTSLVEALDVALAGLRASGVYEELRAQYLGP